MKGEKSVKSFCQAETRRTLHTHAGSFFLILLLTMFVVSGAFATDIPSSASTADCKNNPLDTYSGTSNLAVDWAPNEIALHWYDGDTEITSGVQTSCVYDGTLTPPTPTPREGYVFTGWRVRQAAGCSFSGLDPSIGTDWDATHARWKPFVADGWTRGWSMADEFGTENSSDLNPGEWAVTFSYGTVKGMAKCSAKSGNNNGFKWSNASSNWSATESELTSASGEAQYCWCSATNYTLNGGNQCNVSSSSWVFYDNFDFADFCATSCASFCAKDVQRTAGFRRAVFGVQ